jgi:2,3-bisphosphoglycerate-dependent phosphoglycerate mutase
MAALILVRHGQSIYNLENRFTGNLDIALTPLGREEARIAGGKLTGFTFAIAYTSTLIRAQETLRIILEEIKQTGIPIVQNSALDERMYGNLQGLNKAETAAKYSEAQVEIWRRSYAVRPPEGESLEDTFNRTVPYFQREIEPKLREGNNVLIVAHGNSLRALKMYLEHISASEIAHINIPTGTPRLYNFDADLKIMGVKYL